MKNTDCFRFTENEVVAALNEYGISDKKEEVDGIILEFKVQDTNNEKELTDTVKEALKQIERQKYETLLVEKQIPREDAQVWFCLFWKNCVDCR